MVQLAASIMRVFGNQTRLPPLTLGRSRTANSAAAENKAILLCPRRASINAASSGPIADLLLPTIPDNTMPLRVAGARSEPLGTD